MKCVWYIRVLVFVIAFGLSASRSAFAQYDNTNAVSDVKPLFMMAVVAANAGSKQGVDLALRSCRDIEVLAKASENQLRSSPPRLGETNTLMQATAPARPPENMMVAIAFCAALKNGTALPDEMGDGVVDPTGERVTISAALSRARSVGGLATPTPPPVTPPTPPPPPPPPDVTNLRVRSKIDIELSGGVLTPLVPVGVYAPAPTGRLGVGLTGERFRLGVHLVGFGATSRGAPYGFGGVDLEPGIVLVHGPLNVSVGAMLTAGVLGRQLPTARQATPYGSAAPELRLEVPLRVMSPHLVIAGPGVALLRADDKLRPHGFFTAQLGFNWSLTTF